MTLNFQLTLALFLNFRQQVFYEFFQSFGKMHEQNQRDPLKRVLAPHIEKAFERLMASFDTLKQACIRGTPLLDEALVRSVRDQVVRQSLDEFDRLAAQSFDDRRPDDRSTRGVKVDPVPAGRRFGVEFEGFVPSDEKFLALSGKLGHLMAAFQLPRTVALLPKTDEKYTGWAVTFDASVKNPLRFTGKQLATNKVASLGLEVVSPILDGQNGERQMHRMLKILKLVNMRTNESTGLHVHVDLSDARLEQLQNLGKALIKNEAKLNALIDPERRGGRNDYCKSIPVGAISAIEKATSISDFVEAMNPGKDRNMMFDFSGLVIPNSPTTIQYRGEGGANCLATAHTYVPLLVRFTDEALNNPDIDLDTLMQKAE